MAAGGEARGFTLQGRAGGQQIRGGANLLFNSNSGAEGLMGASKDGAEGASNMGRGDGIGRQGECIIHSNEVFELDRTSGDENFGLDRISRERLSSSANVVSSSAQAPFLPWASAWALQWSTTHWHWPCVASVNVASSSGSVAGIGIGSGSVAGASKVSSSAEGPGSFPAVGECLGSAEVDNASIRSGDAQCRQRRITSLQVPFPRSGKSRGL